MSPEERVQPEPDKQLTALVDDFNFVYKGIQDNIIATIDERIRTLGLPASTKETFIVRGIEILTDLALKIAIAKTTNKDNLALKALDSNANMIGMMAQGGIEIAPINFRIYYTSLKEIMDRGGVVVPEYVDPPQAPKG